MLLFVILTFVIFAVALGGAAYYVWAIPHQKQNEVLSRRLRQLRRAGAARNQAPSDLLRSQQEGRWESVFEWLAPLRRLQDWIDQANLKYRSSDVFVICLGIAVAVFLIFGFLGLNMIILRLVFALGLGSIPIIRILMVRGKRLKQFEEKLPEAIDLFSRSMKAGHNIHSGLETIARETSDPIRMEFRKVVEQLALGIPLEQALHTMGHRIPIIDLKFFVTGLILQRQTGANMVEVLDNLASLVRERLNLMEKIKSSTAMQRLSGTIIALIPVVFGVLAWVASPDLISLLWTDPTGQTMLTYAIVSEVIGYLIVRKLANPKV